MSGGEFQGPIEVTDPIVQQRLKDFQELSRARSDPFRYMAVAIVQEVRRHPRLKTSAESLAKRIGRPINLSSPLA